jgi:uncharacterized protein (TIGR03000 family)
MYSIVLMAAMGGGPDAAGSDVMLAPAAMPAPVVGYGGCYGCSGAFAGGCFGSCYGSWSYGCAGSCHGGGRGHFLGRRAGCHGGGLFGHHRASCHGCSGYSCSGWNCFGSGYAGCCGGGYAGCWGSAFAGAGCYGSYSYAGCHGCYGAVPVAPMTPGAVVPGPVVPGTVVPGTTAPGTTTPPVTPEGKDKKGDGETAASIKFTVPAAARLFVDGRPTSATGAERSFVTPPLAAGQKFFYEVRAELVVDGQTVTEEQTVIVQAGAEVRASFPKLTAAAERAASVASK